MEPLTYAAAGVDVEAGDRAVELMKAAVARTHGPQVVGGVGGFAGLYDLSLIKDYRRPLLAGSTDGVGTKVAIAQALDTHDTIGLDLVAMVVDDIVVCGAKPLLMTDYIACGKVVPERIAAIVARHRPRLLSSPGARSSGGETAEHPGLLVPDEYDVAGAAFGVVEADDCWGPVACAPATPSSRWRAAACTPTATPSSAASIGRAGWRWSAHVDEFGRTLGEELLEPTRIYAADGLDLAGALGDDLHALSTSPAEGSPPTWPGCSRTASTRWSTAAPGSRRRLRLVARLGGVPRADLERTLNLGVGMVAVVAPGRADAAVQRLAARGLHAWLLGSVAGGPAPEDSPDVVRGTKGVVGGAVVTTGEHPR